MKQKFSVVNSELPNPPYPANTRNRGLRFELDTQRILQSKTWQIATQEQRNYMLRLWVESWNAIPVGSLENDDELLAATLGLSLAAFAHHRNVILRGWVLHSDDRLYHPVIGEQVLRYADMREKERERKAKYRQEQERRINELRAMSHGTDTGRQRKDTGVRTQEQEQEQGQGQENHKTPPYPPLRGDAPSAPVAGLDSAAWRDYLNHRKAIRARRLKAASVERLQHWLVEQGEAQIQRAIVDQTIRNGWTGLFELKPGASHKPASRSDAEAWAAQEAGDDYIDGECIRD